MINLHIICFLDNCITTSGPDPRRPCVFPFIHEMVEYETCTDAGHDQLWCPTEVDIDPVDGKGYAVVPGKWGNCAKFPPCTGNSSLIEIQNYEVL